MKNAAIAAAKVADIASTQAFADDPLPATGSDPWRTLFEAAKAFSEKAAYPAEGFPVTKDGAVCVLCQQPLTELAALRFQRFQQVILEDAAKKKGDADTALQLAVKALSIIDVTYLTSDATLIKELRAHDEAVATKVEQFFSEASQRKAAALLAAASGEWDALPDVTESPTASLNLLIARMEADAQELDKTDSPEELRKLQGEVAELDDRERLGKHIDEVKAYIGQKKTEVALKACEKALDTTGITLFGSALIEKAVTEQLAKALRAELDFFDVRSVPLNVRKTGEKGKTKHQLTIQAGVRPSGGLSRGRKPRDHNL